MAKKQRHKSLRIWPTGKVKLTPLYSYFVHINISFLWWLHVDPRVCIYFPSIVSPGKMHIPRLPPFPYARQPGLQPSPYNQKFMPQQYYVQPMMSSMQMMAPFTHSPAHSVQASQFSDPPTSSQENTDNGVQKKKNRWTDTEEKILIELFGENEDKLRYRSFNSPEWQSIARQL